MSSLSIALHTSYPALAIGATGQVALDADTELMLRVREVHALFVRSSGVTEGQ